MKRRMLLLTEKQWEYLGRILLDEGESDYLTPAERRSLNVMERVVSASPIIDHQWWVTYQAAAGEMLEAGDEPEVHIGKGGMERCGKFADAVTAAFRAGGPTQ